MRVLVIGSGGREHALCLKIAQSPLLQELYCAPGSDAIAEIAQILPLSLKDHQGIKKAALDLAIDLAVIGPDDCLEAGLADVLREAGLKVYGPNRAAAELEWSKAFAKEFMQEHNLPTAAYAKFTDLEKAFEYLHKVSYPTVIKADGLALGKGVIIAQDFDQAKAAVTSMLLEKNFGQSGSTIVIEDFLKGREFSLLAFCDGKTVSLMPPVEDHKQIYDGDLGPNTGGMGCISPLPYVNEQLQASLQKEIFQPVIDEMVKRGTPFIGTLFIGFMLTAEGPKILEFNARFGDPETQTLMLLLKSDLLPILAKAAEERLNEAEISWHNKNSACLILASPGYPESSTKGLRIEGLETLAPEVTVYHAGTKKDGDFWLTNGGRVLGLASYKDTREEALDFLYTEVKKIHFPGMQYRRDIGQRENQEY